MTNYPSITIAIATFNSANILEKVLISIQNQIYPKDRIKVIFFDGGSTDNTINLANQYKCEVVHNDMTEPVNAKFMAYRMCKTDYLMYLDHDEVLVSQYSFQNKISLFQSDENVRIVSSTGYINPLNYPFINNYINEFGDPFSYFIYHLSKDVRFFIPTMLNRYKNNAEVESGYIFGFEKAKNLPIIEVCAGGGMMDVKYFQKQYPFTLQSKKHVTHFFYYMLDQGGKLGISKNDEICHYSADTWTKYLKKIKWRIKNNIFHTEEMGESGFGGRDKFQNSVIAKYMKFLFIPYTVFLLPCFIDSIRLCLIRKDLRYMVHLILSLYTVFYIGYFYCVKISGGHFHLTSYDGVKNVKI
jgi:glycosyltransferase involved in cell wall biosynthesis